MRYLITSILIIAFQAITFAQDCGPLNINGDFETLNYAPGLEPAVGITSGLMNSWEASHGTADFVTSDWNWYDLPGFDSNMGHICYGSRDTHDHSEGIYTTVPVYGDSDITYTLTFDYASICDSDENGFINIALNNGLNSNDHGFFQFPTEDSYPQFFSSNQSIARIELTRPTNFQENGMSSYEITFKADGHFSQLWFYTEYLYEFTDFVNCGFVLDNVKLTATTDALSGLDVSIDDNNLVNIKPSFTSNLNVTNAEWTINNESFGNESELSANLEDGEYTVCFEYSDSRGACGTYCEEITIGEEEVEEEEEEEERDIDDENNGISFGDDNTDEDEDEEGTREEETDEGFFVEETTNENTEEETKEPNTIDDSVNLNFAPAQIEDENLEVEIYPNPAYQNLNIVMNKNSETTAVIYAANGEKVNTIENLNSKDSIDLMALAPGMYALHLVNGEQRVVKKFFKGQN